MKITFNRVASTSNETLSLASVDGNLVCFGLEDEYRAVKVPGKTRVPAGIYQVRLRNEGNVTKRYAAKFPDIHKGMLWLQDVPGFEWVYIHMGNTDDHSEGCLLVAEQGRIDRNGEITTPSSEPAYRRLYERVVDAAANDNLFAEIIDNDREAA